MKRLLILVALCCVSAQAANIGPEALTTPKTNNLVFAGPTSAGTAVPTFRSLINADLPVIDSTHGGTSFSTYATGDTIYASATNTLSKRTIGNTGQILEVIGGIPTWKNGSVYSSKSADYTITTSDNYKHFLFTAGGYTPKTITTITMTGANVGVIVTSTNHGLTTGNTVKVTSSVTGSNASAREILGTFTTTLASTNQVTYNFTHSAFVSSSATGALYLVPLATLPAASSAGEGFEITIENQDTNGNPCAIKTPGSDTIDGVSCVSSYYVLSQVASKVTLRCDGSSRWSVINTVGDYQEAIIASASWAPGTSVWGDADNNTITLSPGLWDMSCVVNIIAGGTVSQCYAGISNAIGNVMTPAIIGKTVVQGYVNTYGGSVLPTYIVNVTTQTNYYFKSYNVYTSTLNVTGYFCAKRLR